MEDKDKRHGWLRELKVGDKVIIVFNRGGNSVKTVSKITPTGRINVDNYTFDYYGNGIGDSYYHKHLLEWRQELEDKIIKQKEFSKMCNYLDDIRWAGISYEIVEQVYNLMHMEKEVT
jgi:hypothetical protein